MDAGKGESATWFEMGQGDGDKFTRRGKDDIGINFKGRCFLRGADPVRA
jgi:hypothetical protein